MNKLNRVNLFVVMNISVTGMVFNGTRLSQWLDKAWHA
jgi:hypothetical protein